MSLYAQYIQERENKAIVENDKGFATYHFVQEYCYIEDIFVLKEYRKSGLAASFADQITEIAKSKNYNKLLGSVDIRANGATESVKVLLAYGFRVLNTETNLIYFVKDI